MYGGLAALTDRWLLRRIQPAAGPLRDRVGDNHQLIRRDCNGMVEVDERSAIRLPTAADPSGCEIDEAEASY
ncbi:MAG TPA: hypothetical protein VHF25_16225 [Nitriliruptorales bacterium]|nr:hypothetical protein [Nitriliruptorales bacterium]